MMLLQKDGPVFAPAWVVIVVISICVFSSFARDFIEIGMASWRVISLFPLSFSFFPCDFHARVCVRF